MHVVTISATYGAGGALVGPGPEPDDVASDGDFDDL